MHQATGSDLSTKGFCNLHRLLASYRGHYSTSFPGASPITVEETRFRSIRLADLNDVMDANVPLTRSRKRNPFNNKLHSWWLIDSSVSDVRFKKGIGSANFPPPNPAFSSPLS